MTQPTTQALAEEAHALAGRIREELVGEVITEDAAILCEAAAFLLHPPQGLAARRDEAVRTVSYLRGIADAVAIREAG